MSDKGSEDQAKLAKDTRPTYSSIDEPSVADLIVRGMPGLRISDGRPASAQPNRSGRKTARGSKLNVLSRAIRVPETLAIDFGDTFVVVQIGQSDHRRTFAVHENLLCASSPQLKKRLREIPVEHNQKQLSLDCPDPGAFALYVQYLYTGQIPSKPTSVTASNEYTTLCKLYILAYDFEDIPAQNAACDATYAKAMESNGDIQNSLPQREHIDIIYSGTSSPCAARRLLVDLYTAYAKDEWLSTHTETLPQQFMGELALNLMKHRAAWLSHIIGSKEQYHKNMSSEQMFQTG
ncbi:hypothetical protein FB567DRAFT_24152 [Paraphoma chrysanthemicola]|uniref:BTB domain-containing protein n=1 Tax=Paraphoma chrysanthemicola TaxID=798071 RepID=A0A8K0RFP8_9PLEO|nr:hypothetical protein FB567DRAFT_24152 [Paraphoma chrysanthemicola]